MRKLTRESVPAAKAINSLAKSYNTLNYYLQLCALIKEIYPEMNLDSRSKYQLHKLISNTLVKHYRGEGILKYAIASQYFSKSNVVGAFEINVKGSRLDFVAVNGHSTSFEIKSELDNLSKLPKQIVDYTGVFDYNCLVVHEKHINQARHLLPKKWGIWCYASGQQQLYRRPSRNTDINSIAQMSLLSKAEILKHFPDQQGDVHKILRTLSSHQVNKRFKKALKARYQIRWEFITERQDTILPIDFQFFFNNNVFPEIIYQRGRL